MLRMMPEASEGSFRAAVLSRATNKKLISPDNLLTTLRESNLDITMHEVLTLTRNLDPESNQLKVVDIFRLLGVPV